MTATATVTTDVQSEIVEAGEVNDDVTHIGVWGTNVPGAFITSFALTNNPDPLVLGERLVFAANSLIISLDITGVSDYGDEQALRGLFGATRFLTFHDGAPGSMGTANRIAGLAPASLPMASLTFAH